MRFSMERKNTRAFAMGLILVASCGMLCAQNALSPELYGSIDTYVRDYVRAAHIPALTVTIVDADSVLLEKSYGQEDGCDVPFVLGSVSKSFTAVCVMRLVEQGRLDLDAPLSAYLPGATDGDRICVRQLLNHTGGLGEHQTLNNYHIVNEQGVHVYANVNYSLLGNVIEAVSGMPYEQFVREAVFEPLSLSHTAASLEQSRANGLIGGHADLWGFHIPWRHRYPKSDAEWITVPAGYISSSANDLGRYLQMYLRGGEGIISPQSIDTMFYGDTVFVDGDVPYWYGYGWATVKDPLPEPVLRHSGLVETGASCVFIIPGRNIGVALTANVNDYFVTNGMLDDLGWGVIFRFLGMETGGIPQNAYVASHLRIDLIMLAVLAASVIPLCLIPRYKRRIRNARLPRSVLWLCAVHVVLPALILLIVPVGFSTPLWVARAFVPDVYVTVVASAVLLFAGGVAKAVLLLKSFRTVWNTEGTL